MAKARAPTSSAGRVLTVMAVVSWMMLRSVEAATYIAGDATGWCNAVNGASFYSTWASSKTFQVDDVLEEDGSAELAETARLRDRGSGGKKDRERDRDREWEWDKDRFSRGGKRRREDEESSEESVNDEEDEDEDEDDWSGSGSGHHVRLLAPSSQANSLSSSYAAAALNNHSRHNRRSFPPAAKVFRTRSAIDGIQQS